MLNVLKRTSLLLIILMFLVFTGCTNGFDKITVSLNEPEQTIDFYEITSSIDDSEQSITQLLWRFRARFEDTDELLATMAMVKFGEFSITEIPDPTGNIFALDYMTLDFPVNGT